MRRAILGGRWRHEPVADRRDVAADARGRGPSAWIMCAVAEPPQGRSMTTSKKPPAAGKLGGRGRGARRDSARAEEDETRLDTEEPSTPQRRGPKPRGGEVATASLHVLLTPTEHAELQRRAGGRHVGRYVRRRLALARPDGEYDTMPGWLADLQWLVASSIDVERLSEAAERYGVTATIAEVQQVLAVLEHVGLAVERRKSKR